MAPLVYNVRTTATTSAEVATVATDWIKADTAKTIPGISLAQVEILVLSELDGEEHLPEPHLVNRFRHTSPTGTATEFDTDVGLTIGPGGGSTSAGGGTGSSDGSVDGLIGTKLNVFIGIAGVLKVILLSES